MSWEICDECGRPGVECNARAEAYRTAREELLKDGYSRERAAKVAASLVPPRPAPPPPEATEFHGGKVERNLAAGQGGGVEGRTLVLARSILALGEEPRNDAGGLRFLGRMMNCFVLGRPGDTWDLSGERPFFNFDAYCFIPREDAKALARMALSHPTWQGGKE